MKTLLILIAAVLAAVRGLVWLRKPALLPDADLVCSDDGPLLFGYPGDGLACAVLHRLIRCCCLQN
jgi:hypothetical protein